MNNFEKAHDVLSKFIDFDISLLTKEDLSDEEIFSIWEILAGLDSGNLRIAEKINNNEDDPRLNWKVNKIAKIAITLSFLLYSNKIINYKEPILKNQILDSEEIFFNEFTPYQAFFDKIPSKFEKWNEERFQKEQIRVVPQAYVRYSSFIAPKSILMPSFVNMGAYIDSGSMIDTWATIGSCAQIGKKCHISGGSGIGGVLEPINANPTIIEDECFIGARSEICEGVIVGKGSVISMGCFIGSSTKIIDRETGRIYKGFIPPYSVVVPGSYKVNDSENGLSTYCVLIIKKISEETRRKI